MAKILRYQMVAIFRARKSREGRRPERRRGQISGKRIVHALDGVSRGATPGAIGVKSAALHAAVIGSCHA